MTFSDLVTPGAAAASTGVVASLLTYLGLRSQLKANQATIKSTAEKAHEEAEAISLSGLVTTIKQLTEDNARQYVSVSELRTELRQVHIAAREAQTKRHDEMNVLQGNMLVLERDLRVAEKDLTRLAAENTVLRAENAALKVQIGVLTARLDESGTP